jgi:hypothetical protein
MNSLSRPASSIGSLEANPKVATVGITVQPTKAPSFLSRLFTWYRRAVTVPATEEEKAEWQETGF